LTNVRDERHGSLGIGDQAPPVAQQHAILLRGGCLGGFGLGRIPVFPLYLSNLVYIEFGRNITTLDFHVRTSLLYGYEYIIGHFAEKTIAFFENHF
jgi:hypothetical protein